MYRQRITAVLAKIETTSGTDAVPTGGSDAIQVVGEPELQYSYLEDGNRDDAQNATLMNVDKTDAAGRWGQIEITVEVRGGGTAGSSPPADPLIRASGMSKAVVGGTSVTYTTLDDAMETATLYLYGGGKLFKLIGCAASLKISAETPHRGFMTFTVKGRIASDPTDTAVPALTFATVNPPLFSNAPAGIGAWLSSAGSDPLVLRSASIDMAAEIADRPSAGAADGLIGFVVSDRKVAQTMKIETMALSSLDPWTLSKSNAATQPTSAWQVGSVVGNRVKVQTGKWSIKPPKLGGVNSISTLDLDGTLGPGAATTSRDFNLLWD